ncbi:MAG: DUF4874 domain-containing protein [Clostridia bacterium]|nr:DUF4874 domain-containing protein [Clostridia bacterium]
MFKKYFKPMLSALLIVFLVLSVAGCGNVNTSSDNTGSSPEELPTLDIDISGNKEGSAVVERSYTTLYSDSDNLLHQNPERGLRGFFSLMHFNVSKDEIIDELQGQLDSWYPRTQTPIAVCYFFPGDYLGKKLDDDFFASAQAAFDFFRENKIQILLRFAYYDVNVFNERTPTTEELLLHIDQLAENGIIERNKDLLHVFQAGFIGQFGEWHSDVPRADRTAVLTAFADKLLPDGVYSQLRNPKYKDFLADDNPKKNMIGFHNDGWFGIQDTTGLGNQDYSYGLEPWNRQVKEGAYVPNDGEFYYYSQFESSIGYYPDGYACILGMSELRFTTFSAINGWLDNGGLKDGVMVNCMKQPITTKWLEEYGLPYSENWFKDAEGKAVRRNAYEYMRDYLGYRLTANTLSVKEKDKENLLVTLTLENHGFSAAFNMTSRLVILNSDNKEISSVSFGDPKTWHSTNPDDYKDRKQLEHAISADIKLPNDKGEYKLALQLKSKGGGTARLDNNIPFEEGYNILHTFKVK